MDTLPIELIHGSGNVYRDFARPDADVRQRKAMLAAEIIKLLDDNELSNRKAGASTGIVAAELSRIRNADLSRFTVSGLNRIVRSLRSRT
jgi:predicted XRE-type DNA-binding protein